MKQDPVYQAKWLELVKKYKTSNQTMKVFCEEQNIKVHQLQYWLRKYKMRQMDDNSKTFVKVKMDKPPNTSHLLKLTYGKLKIEIPDDFNEGTLLKLFKVVDQLV